MNEDLDDTPTFLEELQIFLERLNKAFPEAIQSGHRHNITLDNDGHLEVTVWHFDSEGKLQTYFCNLDSEIDLFQSIDDIVVDLRKYVDKNAK